jgi:serine protease Do
MIACRPAATLAAVLVLTAALASAEPELIRLQGGGEVFGPVIKETPAALFVDVGPTIIELPLATVLERRRLATDGPGESTSGAGMGTGVYDPETGSLIFRSPEAGAPILSQQQILDRVRRGVVLVSNPGGLGTGWLIDNDGRLITNHHVVGSEAFQTVTLFRPVGDQWERVVIEQCPVESFSSLLDIAIVRLNMDEVRRRDVTLEPLRIADPLALEAGDRVFAVGNPGMGRMVLEHTLSEGIVSSLARNFNDVVYLQTTAAVNPGNSGGPLVNERGEVVGLVTLKAIFQEGVAFALPASYLHFFIRHAQAFAVTETNRNSGFRYHRPQ